MTKSALELAQDLADKARFAANFYLVAAYYRCEPDEIVIMKQLYKEHKEDAKVSFTIMAEECRKLER